MPSSNDKLYLEVEKAKEVMRAAVNLYRAGGSIPKAVNDAEAIADLCFQRADDILATQDTTK